MAIGTGVHPLEHHFAARFREIAQAPGDQRYGRGRQRLDDSLFQFGRHQRHVAVEDGCARGILRCSNRDRTAGDRVAQLPVAEAGNGHLCRMLHRVLLDFAPDGGIRNPGPRRGLLRRQPGRLVGLRHAARIDLADAQPLTRGLNADGGRAVGERHLDLPRPCISGRIAPEKSGRGDLRGEHRAFLGVVDDDTGEGRRIAMSGPGETGADDDGCDSFHRRLDHIR